MKMESLVSGSPARQTCLALLILLLSINLSNAQQSVSIGTSTVKNNAVLYLFSQGKNQGLIIPIVSSKGSVTAEAGMMVYDESDNKLYYRNNSAWVEVGASGGAITLGGDLSGAPATANVAKLQGKTLTATNPTEGQILAFKSNAWVPVDQAGAIILGGDLSGAPASATVSKLQGKTVSAAAPADGQILKYVAATSTWTLANEAAGATYTAGTGISIVTNQISIANDGVTTTQIAPNTITNTDLNKTTIPLSGFGAAAAAVDLGTQRIINVGTPTATTDATTKAYVDGVDATKLNSNVLTTNGDLLFHNGTIPTRLPRGTNLQILQSTATGIQWATSTALTNPLTTVGDIMFGGAAGVPTRLAGSAGFLKSTGAAAPTWSAVNIASTDVSGVLPIANGGTNASTPATARTSLGLGAVALFNAIGSTEITDDQIMDADVNSAAAINGTKIKSDFGNQNVLTTAKLVGGSLQILSSVGSITPLATIQESGATGDAALVYAGPTQSYTVGSTAAGSFKISNSTALGTNDHFEITNGVTDASGLAKVYMDMGPRGQDGLQINSTSDWGTSLHLSNGTSTSTTSGYTLAVTGASGPTSRAGDFAMVYSTGRMMTIGYNSAGPNYATSFPAFDGIFGTTPMRMGINLSSAATPGYNLEVNGNAAKNSGTTWINTSDLRLKKDISKFTDGLNIITRINPIWFRYNGKGGTSNTGKLQVGVAAQEMKEIAPYTVGTFSAPYDANSPPQEFYNFDYNAIGYALINAVKELDSKVKALEQENALLKQQIDSAAAPQNGASQLRAELDSQKARTTQLETELKEIRRLIGVEAKKN